MIGRTRRLFSMDLLTRTLLLLLVAGMGFLAGSVVHSGKAAPGMGKAQPCAQATPAATPSPSRIGSASYKGWTVTVTRFALHKTDELEPPPPGYALYALHMIIDNRGTQTWLLFGTQFRLEDEHHQLYERQPLTIYADTNPVNSETLTPGTKVERDVLIFAPAHGHFRLRVNLPQFAGSPDLVVPLPPLQPA